MRDCLMWLYGSGFPKSHDISKGIDKADTPITPGTRLWHGWGTALKPGWEPIVLAMKPLDGTFAQNAQRWGVAGLNIDGGRIQVHERGGRPLRMVVGDRASTDIYGEGLNGSRAIGETRQGRWPANVLLDEEAAEGAVWSRFFYTAKASRTERNAGLEDMPQVKVSIGDERPSGGSWERRGDGKAGGPQANMHPTVKPLALMCYLCRLTATPTGGTVLDPFMGSGTTGVAAVMEGREFIGIELDAGYFEIAKGRIEAAQAAALGD